MKTKEIQELYQIKLHSMDTILHQISLMDQVENEQELSEIIHSLLQAIGNYTGADRVYVFDWETDQKDSLSNAFEWCADGVAPEIDNLQAIPVSSMPNWVKRFENKEVIVIHDLEATKNSEPEEYELLKTQEICSLIAVPIYANHQMNGFIGVDNPDLRQNEISITLLSDVGGHLGCVRENLKSTVLLKKALDEATKRSEIIAAIATLYVTIVQANVKERTYELLKGHDLVQKILGQKGKIDDVMERLPTAFAAQEERKKYREFLDFDTLTERLRNTNFVSIEFMGVNGEWRLARFIVKSRDAHGNAVDVLYVVRDITEEKSRELMYQKQLKESMERQAQMKERELLMETHLKEAQLKYLQAQINPHFLFNSLNAGAQLAMMGDADNTGIFLEKMADFFRYNVRKMEEDAMLWEEIGAVDNYIYILNVRFAGDITYIKEVDEGIDNIRIPSMILQPLVENAVQHGIHDCMEAGWIRMEIHRNGEMLDVTVSDNGAGMTEEMIARVMAGRADQNEEDRFSTGIAVRNVIDRLQLYYKEENLFTIESDGPGKGTRVHIILPVYKDELE